MIDNTVNISEQVKALENSLVTINVYFNSTNIKINGFLNIKSDGIYASIPRIINDTSSIFFNINDVISVNGSSIWIHEYDDLLC